MAVTLWWVLSLLLLLAVSEEMTVAEVQDECSQWTDCFNCTSHKSWTGTCEYCQVPEPITGAVCHDPYSPVNPCNLFCRAFNVEDPEECPKPRPPLSVYDPTLAKKMLHLSSAAYSDYPNACFQNLPTEAHWKLYKSVVKVSCDYGGNICAGYTAISTLTKSIAVAFRGSTSFGQVLEELAVGVFPRVTWPAGGGIISYFYKAFELLWPKLSIQFKELLDANPGYTVYVTGHSLGGALASLAASQMVYDKIYNNPIVYTFGQPRVGDYDYAVAFDKAIPNAWRVVHYADPVPHVPLCGTFLIDPPTCSPCGAISDAYHHAQEIWYNTTNFFFQPESKYTTCKGWIRNEDISCSDSEVHWQLPCLTPKCLRYHTYYFGMAVGDCGYSNCSNVFICDNPATEDPIFDD